MSIEVTSASLSFLSSTLTKLSEWAQDEIIPTPLPMSIRVTSVKFMLTDDADPAPGCPVQPPVHFNIPHLTLTRDKSGTFNIQSSPNLDNQPVKQQNDSSGQLRKELDLALAEVRILRAKLAEKDEKIAEMANKNKELSTAHDQTSLQIGSLVEEKKSLLETLKYLQEELIKSGKK